MPTMTQEPSIPDLIERLRKRQLAGDDQSVIDAVLRVLNKRPDLRRLLDAQDVAWLTARGTLSYAHDVAGERRDDAGKWTSGGSHAGPAADKSPSALPLSQVFKNLNLPNDREQAVAQLHERIDTAKTMAKRYRGLYRRAMTLHAKTGKDKYVQQAEMYRGSAIREQKKPAFLAGIIERIGGKERKSRRGKLLRYDSQHAPAGGVTVQGKFYPGGEFIPGEVLAKATAAEKDAIKGTDPSPPTELSLGTKSSAVAALKGRAKLVRDEAAKLTFSDDIVVSKTLDRRDTDDIQEAMTDDERHQMEQDLEEIRANVIEEEMREYDPDEYIDSGDRADAAKEAGWSDEDIKDKAIALMADIDEGDYDEDVSKEYVEELIDDWYRSTSKHGEDAMNELVRHLRRNDCPPIFTDAFDGLSSDLSYDVDKELESRRDNLREEKEQELKNGYDDGDDRREYLSGFYDNNEDRFSGERKEGEWGRDGDGDRAYCFSTSGGAEYTISTFDRTVGGLTVRELVFQDDSGSFAITGAGGAHEVFGAVTTATTALLLQKDAPKFLSFTAAEASRQKLYDRLVRSTAAATPEYAAVAAPMGGVKRYFLIKRENWGQFEEFAKSQGANMAHEVIRYGKGEPEPDKDWVIVEPHTDPDWFTPEGWPDEEQPSKSPQSKTPPSPPEHYRRAELVDYFMRELGFNVTRYGFDPNEPRNASGEWSGGATSKPASHTPDTVQAFADESISTMRTLHKEHEAKHGFNKGPHNKKLADEVHARMAQLDSMAAATKHKPTLKAIADAKQRLGTFVRALV